MAKKNVFDFLKGEKDETATGGNPEETEDLGLSDSPPEESPKEIATGGSPESCKAGPVLVHQGLTKEQVLEGQRQAESPRGLDMAQFMKTTGIGGLDFEELLKYKAE